MAPNPSLMLLKKKAPTEAAAVAETPAVVEAPAAAAPKKAGGLSFNKAKAPVAAPVAAPAAPVVETPVAAAEPVADTSTAQADAESVTVDVTKMSSAEIDKLVKENGIEGDMPEGFAKMKVAEKRAVLNQMFGGEQAAAEDAPVETATAAEVTPAPKAGVPAVAAPKAKAMTPSKAKAGVTGELVGPDAIADFASHVENLKEPDALALAAKLSDDTDATYFRLGGVLAVIQTNSWFAPYASFREYVEKERGIQYRTALYWVGIYNAMVEQKIPWDAVKSLGWSKLKEIATVITLETVADWVAIAEKQTVMQLNETVRKAKAAAQVEGGETQAQIEEGASSTVTTKTFKVHEDQKKNIELALEKAKKDAGTQVDTVALDFICLDFMAGNAKAGKAAKLPSLAEQLKAAGDEAAFAAITEAFPSYNISVEVPE